MTDAVTPIAAAGDGCSAAEQIRVTVVYALPDQQFVVERLLPRGARVADALANVARLPFFAALDLARVPVGVYGERVERDRALLEHDRVEIYRPLQVDPVEARRQRSRANQPRT